jgi:hypothetical protein
MTDLVACLGAGKGTWGVVEKLSSKEEFENVFLILNDWTKKTLQMQRKNLHLITVNSDDKVEVIRDSIVAQMTGKVNAFEVAVNIESGTGKEHTAIITALMRLGLGFRFVMIGNDKVEEVSFSLEIPKEEFAE